MADTESGRRVPVLPTARFVRRLLCVIYEGLLLGAIGLAATAVLLMVAHLAGWELSRPLLQVYLVLVAGCYFVPQWRAGQTLPMKTWRIRVVSADGDALTTRQALARYALATLGWLLAGATCLWALADRDGQFLHDRLAGTRLVSLPGTVTAAPGRK